MRSRRVSALTAALAFCATLTTPAAAETRILFSSGAWSAFGGTADDGRRVCGVITGGPHGKTMAITYFQGTSFLEVQIGKTSWAIPDGTRVRMTLQFGNGAPWVAPGRGRGNVVYGRIAGDQVRAFMTELRAAGSGVLEFLDGNEGSWAIDLTGSGSAVVVMMQCVARLIDGGRSTQPYGGSGVGTQPHGSTPPAPAPAPRSLSAKGLAAIPSGQRLTLGTRWTSIGAARARGCRHPPGCPPRRASRRGASRGTEPYGRPAGPGRPAAPAVRFRTDGARPASPYALHRPPRPSGPGG